MIYLKVAANSMTLLSTRIFREFGAFLCKTFLCHHSLHSSCKIPVNIGSGNFQVNQFWLRAKSRTDDQSTAFDAVDFENASFNHAVQI